MKSTEGIGAPTSSEDSMPWKFKGCSKQIMNQTCRLFAWPTLGGENDQEVVSIFAVSIFALQWRDTADMR